MANHFFDVGANVGQTFDDFLLNHPQFDGWDIWCFEPSPRHVPALIEKARALTSRYRIHICPFGLRGRSGPQTFFQKDDERGDSFESYLASDHETVNLDTGYLLHSAAYEAGQFILQHTAPDDKIWLKLDCEGSEFDLLSTLIGNTEALARVDQILVEWHTIQSIAPIRNIRELHLMYLSIGKRLERWAF
ncbi:MAG: FkbM family methyltransferase [Verrucomicrobium sp.]|nr:FkbM family methyltransferase [Verrucomicrobium sp.]